MTMWSSGYETAVVDPSYFIDPCRGCSSRPWTRVWNCMRTFRLTKIAYDGTKVDVNSQWIAAPAGTAHLEFCEHACRWCASCWCASCWCASCCKVRVDCLRSQRRCVTSTRTCKKHLVCFAKCGKHRWVLGAARRHQHQK